MRLLAPRPRLRPGRMLLGFRPVCRWKSWEVYRSKEEKPYYVTTPIFYVNGGMEPSPPPPASRVC